MTKRTGLKTRARWALGGGVAAILIALYIGLTGGGMGSGSNPPSTNVSDMSTPATEAPAKYFVIEVNESRILVDGTAVTAGEAASAAKKDGRPVEVRWVKAYTDAEASLKRELRAADVSIARETR